MGLLGDCDMRFLILNAGDYETRERPERVPKKPARLSPGGLTDESGSEGLGD
jgi:hypothetical protein